MTPGSSPTSLAPTQQMQWELMSALWPEDPGRSRVLTVDNRRLSGPVDHAAMREAFAALMLRHDALRLVFNHAGVDASVAIRDDVEPPVEFLDLSGLATSEQRSRVDDLVFQAKRLWVDLRKGPLWRAWLTRFDQTSHLLTVSFSHVIADAAACAVFVEDLLLAYASCRAGEPRWPHPAPSFAEIHALQASHFAATAGPPEYWRARLVPIPQEPVFVCSAAPTADLLARARVPFDIEPRTVAGIHRVAWRARTSPFVALLAAYHVLLCLITGKERTVIASGTYARPTDAERRSVMQFVSDALVSTPTPDKATLRDVVAATHFAMTEGIAKLAPYLTVARAVNPNLDSARPWADYNFCDGHLYSAAIAEPERTIGGITVKPVYIAGQRRQGFRSELTVAQLPGQVYSAWEAWCGPSIAIATTRDRGVVFFNDKIIPIATIRTLVDRYRWVINAVGASTETDIATLRTRYAETFGPLTVGSRTHG